MNIDELVRLNEEQLEDVFSWVDWREQDADIVAQFSQQVDDTCKLTCEVDADGLTLLTSSGRFRIPLTKTGADRYVVLCSCAELCKASYDVWLYKPALDDDTHGFLVLTKEESAILRNKHSEWKKRYLSSLKLGKDLFNDVSIPYLHHEDRMNLFRKEYAAIEQKTGYLKASEPVQGIKRTNAAKGFLKEIINLIKIIFLVALALFFYQKLTEPECRVMVNDKCISYQKK